MSIANKSACNVRPPISSVGKVLDMALDKPKSNTAKLTTHAKQQTALNNFLYGRSKNSEDAS